MAIINEVSFYTEFATKFKKYLDTYFDGKFQIHFSVNKNLDQMIAELEALSKQKIRKEREYIPKLKLDIVFAICFESEPPRLVLFEAKYLDQLSLIDYSQLVGYLQVAKFIEIGLLLLIQKPTSSNKLSNDFREIIEIRKLPMDWTVHLKSLNETHNFKTGIVTFAPGGIVEWVSTKEILGISSFEELCSLIH